MVNYINILLEKVKLSLCELKDGSTMENMRVSCYSGHRGEETPRQFWLDKRCVNVRKVIDSWLAPDHRYFKLLGDDGGEYILRHDPYGNSWEMIFFNQVVRHSPQENAD